MRKLPTGAARRVLLGIAGALVVAAAAGIAKAISGEEAVSAARLEVDLSERRLYVYHGDELWDSFPVAVGTKKHPTPAGSYRINRIVWNPGWVPPDSKWAEDETPKKPGDPENPMQGAKIFFKYPTYYIHGTNAPGSLGTAASHGCIRMRTGDVRRVAKFVQQHGGATRDASWFERIWGNKRNETAVRLSSSVPLKIRR